MTQNQINYWKYVEDMLQNQRVINETRRHNKIAEAQNQYALEENKRHNLESELIGLKQASAAATSAAAAYSQAMTRSAELEQTKWVDSQVQTRQDLIAQADIGVKTAEAGRIEAQTGYLQAQTVTELAREGLITSQTALADAQAIGALVGVGTDILSTGTKVISTFARLLG